MKSSVVFAVLSVLFIFVATISARPDHSKSDLSTFDEEREVDYGNAKYREHSRRGQRRRHSRQISNRYDYFSPSFYDFARELHTIREQLKELADSIKNWRTPPTVPAYGGYPPQLVYIPVPMPALGSSCSCNNSSNIPNINDRNNFNGSPVWGGSQTNKNEVDVDDDDEGRPISFKPVNGNKPQGRPAPPVEHGSIQAGLLPITTTTTTTAAPTTLPGKCEAAILTCCRFNDAAKQCFEQSGCTKTYNTGLACTDKVIQMVIKRFRDAYAPR